MKKGLIVLGIAAVLGGIFLFKMYNNFVRLDEQVSEKWAQVQNVYQRRADLIPNLVNVVQGYASHERATLTEVIEARAQATQITPQALQGVINDPQAFQRFQQAQDTLSSALSKLMVVVERYPDLKANQNFLQLQDQLEGTENRITVERQRYNEMARDFNQAVRQFPANLFSSLFGFPRKAYFEAGAGIEKAPVVSFPPQKP